MQNKNILIAGGVLVVLLGLLGVAAMRNAPTSSATSGEDGSAPSLRGDASLPDLDGEAITEFTVHRADEAPITLRRSGEGEDATWRVTAPLDADADQQVVATAIQKLDELAAVRVVAENATHHGRLEVDDARGVRVLVKVGDEEVADLIFGTNGNGQQMVRPNGQDAVIAASGTIRHAFNRELSSWREKRIVNVSPERVNTLRFEVQPAPGAADADAGVEDAAPAGPRLLAFARGEEWAVSEGEAIERFSGSRVQAVASTLARLRATDFAGEDVTPEAAGFGTPAATVTLTLGPEPEASADGDAEEGDAEEADAEEADADAAAPESVVLELGAEAPGNAQFYVRLRGGETIYTISRYSADRLRADPSLFQEPEPGAAPAEPPAGLGMPGHGGMGGPGGQQIPPELMQQIQEQMRQQGLAQ